MNLHEGKLFWPTTHDGQKFNSLDKDIECDITIVGGGMSGMLCAYFLSSEGYKVTLIEKNEIAEGSSSANTGLLQYSSDIMLHKLAEQIGEHDAFLFYDMCLKAMDSLLNLPESLRKESDLIARNSLYLASDKEGCIDLKNEYEMLKNYNFPVELIDSEKLMKDYNVKADLALITKRDAEINPYKFIYALAKQSEQYDLEIYENTQALEINYGESKHRVKTENGNIETKVIILATGYEGDKYNVIKKGELNRTFAIATEPLDSFPWNDQSMIWETATPYLYARMTADNRIIAGGLDQETDELVKDQNFILNKGKKILEQLSEYVPGLDTKVEFVWEAVFGESSDELPFIGEDPEQERLYYCLGFGGNGTVYSMAGAKIITDLLQNRKNPYSEIVKLDR